MGTIKKGDKRKRVGTGGKLEENERKEDGSEDDRLWAGRWGGRWNVEERRWELEEKKRDKLRQLKMKAERRWKQQG